MLIHLLSRTQATDDKYVYLLIAAAAATLLTNEVIFQKRRRNFLLKLLLKKALKKKFGGRGMQPWLKVLLILIGGTALLGLLFSWSIALWVLLGVVGISLLVLVFNLKPPKPDSPEEAERKLKEAQRKERRRRGIFD